LLSLLHCLRKFGETLSSAVDCGDLDLLAEQAQHDLAADAARRARYDGNALLFAHLFSLGFGPRRCVMGRVDARRFHPLPRLPMLLGAI
jgi:hypothetical protein